MERGSARKPPRMPADLLFLSAFIRGSFRENPRSIEFLLRGLPHLTPYAPAHHAGDHVLAQKIECHIAILAVERRRQAQQVSVIADAHAVGGGEGKELAVRLVGISN